MAIVNFNVTDVTSVSVPRAPKEMISVRPDESGKTYVRINSSSLSNVQECLRKSQYSLDEKWKPLDESPATIFGSAVHKALEVFYLGDVSERKMVPLEVLELTVNGQETTDGLLVRAVRAFAKKAEPLRDLPDTDKRSLSNGAWILHNYFKTFIDDPYVVYSDDLGPFVEREFTLRYHEDDEKIIDIFGTVDFALRHTTNGNIVIGDHKTASSLGWGGSSYFDRDKPNHQYTMYALGARDVFGIVTEDFMVNVIEVKAKPKTARGQGPSFPRQVTKRTQDDFDELKETVLETVDRYLKAKRTGVWPLGPVLACNAYGRCSFKEVCSAPKSLRKNILNAKFKQEK